MKQTKKTAKKKAFTMAEVEDISAEISARRITPDAAKRSSRDWLKWDGGLQFHCERCGEKFDGSMGQKSISLRMAVAIMRAFIADHAKCKAER